MARRGKRGLSAEDRALWNRVAETATPLHPRTRSLAKTGEQSSQVRPAKSGESPRPPDPLPRFEIGSKAKTATLPPASTGASRPSPPRMDHGAYKKMLRGKMRPEARIDLHGMTLAQAHPELISFILRAQDSGKRLVLVITGKGKGPETADPIPVRRGILKHQVPMWLSAPPLITAVLDVREAHQRHGGGGAYYVYLKKRR